MKYTIGKWFAFEAMHSLPHLPEGHKCRNPHGHSYRVQLVLSAESLDVFDFVTDYGELGEFQAIIDGLDHGKKWSTVDAFCQSFGFRHSTAERVAEILFHKALAIYGPQRLNVECVEVRETEKTFARFGL